ncbi:hypothetical protein LCM17_04410 [Cereibacter sphaeroides]|nr:hypothetical protein [Cereibacter sphaeroides]
MAPEKLYRTPMAELAGLTAPQLDYFVRIGAVSPDLGDKRKHYSPFEAALVLIAGQLGPNFKEQSVIAQVIADVRAFAEVPGVPEKTLQAVHFADFEAERVPTGGSYRQRFESEQNPRAKERMRWTIAETFAQSQGFIADLFSDTALTFMQQYCALHDRDFEIEFEKTLTEIDIRSRRGTKPKPGVERLSERDWMLRHQFFEAIEGSGPFFLHVATDGAGGVETKLDGEPVIFPGYLSWLTLNLGPLFRRLHPYISTDFANRASDYAHLHGFQLNEDEI